MSMRLDDLIYSVKAIFEPVKDVTKISFSSNHILIGHDYGLFFRPLTEASLPSQIERVNELVDFLVTHECKSSYIKKQKEFVQEFYTLTTRLMSLKSINKIGYDAIYNFIHLDYFSTITFRVRFENFTPSQLEEIKSICKNIEPFIEIQRQLVMDYYVNMKLIETL